MYDTTEEARQKLEGSLVLYKEMPVQIIGAEGAKDKVRLIWTPIPYTPHTRTSSSNEITPISDNGWDFKNFGTKLGYVNVSGRKLRETLFVSRVPARHSRQGLDQRTVWIKPLPESKGGFDWQELLGEKGLIDTFQNKFESPEQVFKALVSDPQNNLSIAFSRKLAMSYDRVSPPVLIYRNDKVGYTEDGITFKLASHKSFLREELEDMENLKIA